VKIDEIAFRPATEGDYDFLVTLYGSTRQEELDLTQWDESQRHAFILGQFAAQQNHYRTSRPAGREELILLDGVAVGRLYSDLSGDSDHLLDLCLLPDYRYRGIGSMVLQGILATADAKARRVTIYVESFNRSLSFFERHGFKRVQETGMHFLMEWQPKG
jgi:ribosomal protein S18 acetylase RimI-like enzyme